MKGTLFSAVAFLLSVRLAAGQVPAQLPAAVEHSPAPPGAPVEAAASAFLKFESAGVKPICPPDCFPSQAGVAGEQCCPTSAWVGLDYTLMWLKAVCLKPPTLTLGSPADAVPGAIGQPHTVLVMGEHKFEFNGASGLRPSAGVWLTPDQSLALVAEGFYLERTTASQSFRSSNGSPASFIPFQDPANVNQALPFSVPGVVNGTATAIGRTRLWGAEANLATSFTASRGGFLLDGALLTGFRYLDLRDSVTAGNAQSLVADPTAFAFGADHFGTHNQFYGAQLGTRLEYCRNNWSLDLTTKMALGITHQVSDVSGQPMLPGSTISPGLLPGPLPALPSNVGRQAADRISLVPEMAVKFHYRLTDTLSLTLGYRALYMNKVLCPGDQMDQHVNITQLPFHGPVSGPALPAPMFNHTDAFAHGIDAGFEVRF
jgi:hypothetical protein